MTSQSTRELLNKALKRLDEIRAEQEALQRLVTLYRRALTTPRLPDGSATEQPDLYGMPSTRTVHAARVADLMDAARVIILAAKRPLKRGEIVKRLTEQGYEIVGADKNKVLGTNLWRSGRFLYIDGQGYWPNDVER